MPLSHLGGAHIFRGEFPRFSRDFLWHPLAPPLPPPGPRTHCRQIPGTQAPPGGVQGATRPISGSLSALASPGPLAPPGPPLAPPGPPWPPLAPLAPPGPPWPHGRPWPPLAPCSRCPFSAEETSACLAAKAEVGIEGASPKP